MAGTRLISCGGASANIRTCSGQTNECREIVVHSSIVVDIMPRTKVASRHAVVSLMLGLDPSIFKPDGRNRYLADPEHLAAMEPLGKYYRGQLAVYRAVQTRFLPTDEEGNEPPGGVHEDWEKWLEKSAKL